MSPDDCLFCEIVAGTRGCHRVLETDDVLCFMDIFPAGEGHTLVIPKRHAESLLDIAEPDLLAVAAASRRVARALQAALDPDGITFTQANGSAAGQTVMHYHVHLIPRTRGERMGLHGGEAADSDDLARLADAIAAHL